MSFDPETELLDWAGRNTAVRDVVIGFSTPLAICLALRFTAISKHEAFTSIYLVMGAYLICMLGNMFVLLLLRRKLKSSLRLFRDLPTMDGYARAVVTSSSEVAKRQFFWYARISWIYDFSYVGFGISGLFYLFVP